METININCSIKNLIIKIVKIKKNNEALKNQFINLIKTGKNNLNSLNKK